MTVPKTTNPSPAPASSGTTPAGTPATRPESGAQKGRELGDDELDKVAGGFGANFIVSAVQTSLNNFNKALPGLIEAANKTKTDSK